MRIVILESLAVSDEILNRYLQPLRRAGHEVECFARTDDIPTQIRQIGNAEALIIANMPLKKEVIEACPNLKYIDIAFTGYDHIDMSAARARGIAVSNASGYATEAVAELVIGGVINLYRQLNQADKLCRGGKTKAGLSAFELHGRTVGLIGTGAIGSRTAELFRAFGCKTIAYNGFSHKPDTDVIKYLPLKELLEQSDILSLHCPLTDASRNFINRDNLKYMKKSAILVNTARGAVVNSQDLADALNNGQIAGAVIDVFENEPPLESGHPLLHTPNTLVTPHLGFFTREAMEKRAKIVFNNLACWLKGTPVNLVG